MNQEIQQRSDKSAPINNIFRDAAEFCNATWNVLEFVLTEQGISCVKVADAFVFDAEHNETVASHLCQLFQ